MPEGWERLRGYGYRQHWLARRPGPSGTIYRCLHEQATRQVRRVSLRTADPDDAQRRLEDWVNVYADMPESDPRNVTVARCLQRYVMKRGEEIASVEQARIASVQILEAIGEITVAELTIPVQERLIASLRARGQANGTISRVLSVLRAALNWSRQQVELTHVPHVIDVPKAKRKKRAASLEELVAFANAIEDEHLRRYLLFSLGTAGRPTAVLELTRDRCDVDGRCFEMNPVGRLQTKKYRPMIRMAESLVPIVETVRFGPMITKNGKPLKAIRSVWNRTRDRAGLPKDFTPYIIRHTVATWLRRQRVPFEEIEEFLGHRHNSTTEDYIHVDSTIQENAAVAVDRLIQEIGRAATQPISEFQQPCVTPAYQAPLKVVGATGIEPVTPTMST